MFALKNQGGSFVDVALVAMLLPLVALLLMAGLVARLLRKRSAVEIELTGFGITLKLKSNADGESMSANTENGKEGEQK